MTPAEFYKAGRLKDAIEASNQLVRSRPQDVQPRAFLFELLCFDGDLDRAEKQLDVIGKRDSQSEWGVQVYSNILAAERARRLLFSEGRPPGFLLDEPDSVRLHLQAVDCLRGQRPDEAKSLLDEAERQRPRLDVELNGNACDDFRDCDDLVAPVLEFLLLRDYLWVPFQQIRELEISAPERPRDLIWAPARIVLVDDSQRRGYVPSLYHGSHAQPDEQIKMGRATDWQEDSAGLVRGLGQRVFLAGSEGVSILEARFLKRSVA
jgi:type VI secretion system protein ImpE